ncbi:MAG: leucine dehydrogenase [Deltaproteobacteria bacterium HGW-Deltaproteobacteria-14]|jgi:leucine dehydrogenase|nr:MAG: leucine dehydrogenase [Deltaproteobacteria bacterium HGW-Deltaproteobacteria-14]
MLRLTEVRSRHSAAAGCDALYEVAHERIGVVGFIALHELANGPGVGGIRRLPYPSERAAVQDAVLLAEQMTLKTALAGLPAGGAKAVVIDRPGLDLAVAYGAIGDAIEALDGQYFCGADLGTSEAELAYVRQRTTHVNLAANEPADSTAAGVLYAIDAALRHCGIAAAGTRAMVQGVGSIGSRIAAGLVARGAVVAISDILPDRIAALHAQLPGVAVVPPAEDLLTDAVLLSPCAVGQVVTAARVPQLRCKLIVGAANNQLDAPCLGEHLAEAGILYVPDFAVNAGAVIEGVMTRMAAPGEDVRPRIDAAIAAIGERTGSILAEASESGWTPLEVALSRVDRPRPVC